MEKLGVRARISQLGTGTGRDEKSLGARYSVGMMAGSDGVIHDTAEGMPAAKAGLQPGSRSSRSTGASLRPIYGTRRYRSAKSNAAPIELMVENTDYFRVVKLDYHGGEKYPHLVRDGSKPVC